MLSCTQDCHALRTVMHSRLSYTQTVMHSRLMHSNNHALKTVMLPRLSCTQDCHAPKTVMHSRLSCTLDWIALKTVMHSRLSCTQDCHALKQSWLGMAFAALGMALAALVVGAGFGNLWDAWLPRRLLWKPWEWPLQPMVVFAFYSWQPWR